MPHLSEFDYPLPEGAIATSPAEPRDHSRLMRLPPGSGEPLDFYFYDLPDLLSPGSLLVVNDAQVIPARIIGRRASGGAIEALLVRELSPGRWTVKIKKAAKLKPGEMLEFGFGRILARFEGRFEEADGILAFASPQTLFDDLEAQGYAPLPPYLLKARGQAEFAPEEDKKSYQTIFAKTKGAVAAPTAGLHMTQPVLAGLQQRQIEVVPLNLQVGLGTFEPVRVEEVSEHRMHLERVNIPEATALAVNQAKAEGRKIVALGTTSLRAIESGMQGGELVPGARETGIFIYPPYRFQGVDQLITNFHQPKSTLLMLVCAFAGQERVLKAYKQALDRGYRFFSYGDAMLLG